jgi:hypothetical protein
MQESLVMQRLNAFLAAHKWLALAIGLGLFAVGLGMYLLIDSPVQFVGLIFVVIGIIIVPTLKELRGEQQDDLGA